MPREITTKEGRVLERILTGDQDAKVVRSIVRAKLTERYPAEMAKMLEIPDHLERLMDIAEDWRIDPNRLSYMARKGIIEAKKYKVFIRRGGGRFRLPVWHADRVAVEALLREKGYERRSYAKSRLE